MVGDEDCSGAVTSGVVGAEDAAGEWSAEEVFAGFVLEELEPEL